MISQVTTIHVYLRFDRNDMLTKLRCDRNVVDVLNANFIHHNERKRAENHVIAERNIESLK